MEMEIELDECCSSKATVYFRDDSIKFDAYPTTCPSKIDSTGTALLLMEHLQLWLSEDNRTYKHTCVWSANTFVGADGEKYSLCLMPGCEEHPYKHVKASTSGRA